MFHEDRVFSPVVVFKDGQGDAGGQGAAGGAGSGGEGGAGDDQSKKTGKADDKDGQQHFDKGFNLGFGKGAEKAERDAKARESALLQTFGIDPGGDVQAQVTAIQEKLKGKTDKSKDQDKEKQNEIILQQVRSELQKANNTIQELKQQHEVELRTVLIDQALLTLAGGTGLAKNVSPQAAIILFKQDYRLDLDKDRKVTVTQPNGAPVIDQNGNPKPLEAVFKDWIGQNSFLIAASNKGGSDGQPPKDQGAGAGGKYSTEQVAKMSMADYEKARKEGKI